MSRDLEEENETLIKQLDSIKQWRSDQSENKSDTLSHSSSMESTSVEFDTATQLSLQEQENHILRKRLLALERDYDTVCNELRTARAHAREKSASATATGSTTGSATATGSASGTATVNSAVAGKGASESGSMKAATAQSEPLRSKRAHNAKEASPNEQVLSTSTLVVSASTSTVSLKSVLKSKLQKSLSLDSGGAGDLAKQLEQTKHELDQWKDKFDKSQGEAQRLVNENNKLISILARKGIQITEETLQTPISTDITLSVVSHTDPEEPKQKDSSTFNQNELLSLREKFNSTLAENQRLKDQVKHYEDRMESILQKIIDATKCKTISSGTTESDQKRAADVDLSELLGFSALNSKITDYLEVLRVKLSSFENSGEEAGKRISTMEEEARERAAEIEKLRSAVQGMQSQQPNSAGLSGLFVQRRAPHAQREQLAQVPYNHHVF